MDNTKTNEFWEYMELNKDISKINKKIYHWLDCDNLGNIVIDNGGVFWIELTCSLATLPNYVFMYIKRWMKKRGYEYLYDKYPA